ncbi:MAG: PPOX class F420-dependent oxidoreductase [Ktedonobacteraceae bacterium]
MTVDNTSIEHSTDSDPFASLYTHQYALLKTFRKNGDAVPTPIWFASDKGKLYITTSGTAGKVKRIKNNGRATLTPCDQRGRIIGDGKEVEGMAHVLAEAEYAHANSVLLRKYKLMYRMFDVLGFLARRKSTYIEIAPIG